MLARALTNQQDGPLSGPPTCMYARVKQLKTNHRQECPLLDAASIGVVAERERRRTHVVYRLNAFAELSQHLALHFSYSKRLSVAQVAEGSGFSGGGGSSSGHNNYNNLHKHKECHRHHGEPRRIRRNKRTAA
jgi:hypothetical protein